MLIVSQAAGALQAPGQELSSEQPGVLSADRKSMAKVAWNPGQLPQFISMHCHTLLLCCRGVQSLSRVHVLMRGLLGPRLGPALLPRKWPSSKRH